MEAIAIARSLVTRVAIEDLGSHLATLEAELSDGRAIELVRGDTVIAEVRATQHLVNGEPQIRYRPDFKARLRKNFPDGPLDTDMTKVIREDRDSRD